MAVVAAAVALLLQQVQPTLLFKILIFLIMHSLMLNPCWVLHNNSYLILLPMQVVTLILPALSLINLIVLIHQTM